MSQQRPWSKGEMKAWRGAFTAENKLGARKLAYELRHKSAEMVAREQCSREEQRLNGVEASARDSAKRAIADAMVVRRPNDPNGDLYEDKRSDWPHNLKKMES